jgi:DNA-binding beta-propeller fold protein YncE
MCSVLKRREHSPMNKYSCFAAVTAFFFLGGAQIVTAQIPGTTVSDTIDLSPGPDVFSPQVLELNHASHKLYLFGGGAAVKVIDTTSSQTKGGIALGRYAGSSNGFRPRAMGVDESPTPDGNKLYVVGLAKDGNLNEAVRFIDGANDMNLTGENSDLFLPVTDNDFASMAVNSANHKVYVATNNGDIVVIDGPHRQILRTLSPNFGSLLVASPGTNKVFVVNHNGGGMINSADDTFTPLSLFFTATAATVDPDHGRIYFVGTGLDSSNSIFVVDAATGALFQTKTGFTAALVSVAVDPNQNTLYVGTASDIRAFNATDLTPGQTFLQPAVKLACDPLSTWLFGLENYRITNQPDMVFAMNPSNGALARIVVGYVPFEVAVNSRTNRIYETEAVANELIVIDGSNHAVVARIPMIPPTLRTPFSPYEGLVPRRHIAISERLNRIYVPRMQRGFQTNVVNCFIDVFDGETNQFRNSITLDFGEPNRDISTVESVAVDDTRHKLYVTASTSKPLLLVFDTDSEAQLKAISQTVGALAVNPISGRVYIRSDTAVGIVDGNTNTVIKSVPAGQAGDRGGPVAVNRKTNKVYVGNRDANAVTVLDGATDAIEQTFSNANPSGQDTVDRLAVDEVTNRIYIVDGGQNFTNGLGGRLTAFDANNNYQFLGQALVGLSLKSVAINNTSRQIFACSGGGIISVLQDGTPAPADLFGNISTRARVGAGDDVLIGGFIIAGPSGTSKKVMIRALGPSLTQFGLPGAVGDTTLEVHDGNGGVITNDNWKINDASHGSQEAEIQATGLAPTNPLESALVMTLPAGRSVTAIVRGKDAAQGVGLVEVYDLDQILPVKLANISTRGHVGSEDNVMIAGVIITGTRPVDVVLRAIGPSLASFGVPDPLSDPALELRDQDGTLIISNDDWQEHDAEVNAALLAPNDRRESAIVARLYPTNYTAIARGKNGATGTALVEAYYLLTNP